MSIVSDIEKLKKEKNAVILAHYYVDDDVQDVADYIGDSFYLSKVATKVSQDRIIFAGVEFMGESAKILNPEKRVFMPDINADCPMAHMADKDEILKLREQYDDLAGAKANLESVISEINSGMSKRFKEAFAKINVYFSECYVKLFGGGTAYLKLTDPGDVLSSGIDIEVQPPGKKLQSLYLLSGGERALTVIALLFALLSYSPAPFCILDEIDAALDEANVDRFARFLTAYAENTQFIVITHRKGTMEAANVLHGVTMEESGVSKLLSVKLAEKE